MESVADQPAFTADLRYRHSPSPAEPAERNRAAVLDALDAIAAGDKAPFGALFDPEVVFHEAACLPYGGVHRGLQATMAAQAKIHECYDILSPEVEQVLAAGDLVILYLHLTYRVRANGRSGRFPLCELYRFRDGKVVEWRALYFDSNMVAGELAAEGTPTSDKGVPPVQDFRLLYREAGQSDSAAVGNREILVTALDAAIAGDEANFWAIYDDEAVFHEAACLPYGGAHRGIDAVKAGYGRIHVVFDRIHALFEEVLVAGDIAIAYQQIDFRVRGNGRTGSFPVAELFRFRDGKVIEWRACYFDADMVAKAINAA